MGSENKLKQVKHKHVPSLISSMSDSIDLPAKLTGEAW